MISSAAKCTSIAYIVIQQSEELIVAQEALEQANDRLDMAQRAAGAGLWDWNITTNRIEWSSELFDLFGLDPQKSAASFEAWNSVIYPEDREIANFRKQVDIGIAKTTEIAMLHSVNRIAFIIPVFVKGLSGFEASITLYRSTIVLHIRVHNCK